MSIRGCVAHEFYTSAIYNPPRWIAENVPSSIIPKNKIKLFNGPTPIHQFKMPDQEESKLIFLIKRDDLSSFDMSGNKVRKLEFLMADAVAAQHDSVITIGGLQSNHARATAVAARQLGLDPFLILRTREEPGNVNLVGNLLLDRYLCSSASHQSCQLPDKTDALYLLFRVIRYLVKDGGR